MIVRNSIQERLVMGRCIALFALILLTATTAAAQTPERAGFWGDVALGYGSLGCQVCGDRSGGFSGELSIGGTVNRHLRMALVANGWLGSIPETEGTSTTSNTNPALVVMPVFQVYPVGNAGLFLRGGAGFGLAGEPYTIGRVNTGPSSLVGVGYDIGLGPGPAGFTLSLNRVGIHSERNTADYLQAVAAITFH
jgi:hypothetical protein